jgi:hypothetical protein
MEFNLPPDPTEFQKEILYHKQHGKTYEWILDNYPIISGKRALECCLRRTTHRLFWESGYIWGSDQYLNAFSTKLFIAMIIEQCEDLESVLYLLDDAV